MSDDVTPVLPALPVFAPEERVCGNCKLWQAHSVDTAKGWVGPCRLQPQRGLFIPSAPTCDAFVARGSLANTLRPPERDNRPRPLRNIAPLIVRAQPEAAAPSPAFSPPSSPERQRAPDDLGELPVTREELMDLIRQAVGDPHPPQLANKWQGGFVQLVPGNKELQGKELSIDSLFHKIVMIRDRLRTLEQKLNGHPRLTDGEKVELQSYITRVYGSLTSFNVLFRDKNDFFVGQKGDE